MFSLQRGEGVLQGFVFLSQRQALDFVLLVEFVIGFLCFCQLGLQGLALLFELLASLINRLLRLFFQALGQSCHQRQKLIVDGFSGFGFNTLSAVIQLFEIAMNRGF
ncbi:hypothetical protein D3C85_1353100 [compost metagenome]